MISPRLRSDPNYLQKIPSAHNGYLMAEWQNQTGIPTWVGAWMPGNYNKGDSYTVMEQTVFAAFMTSALESAKIPFAVNADTKYYDADTNQWLPAMEPVVTTIFR